LADGRCSSGTIERGNLRAKARAPFHLAAWRYFRSAVVDENCFKLDLLRSGEQNRA
jgi:hypothetical protein